MRIVLPGALPDPREARELLPHLTKTAPSLLAWLERSRATCIVADPAQTYCTAWEYWQLLQHGFTAGPEQTASSGLGPLAGHSVQSGADDPVWLVELSHVSPSRDGAVLIPARDLAITPEESNALFESSQTLFEQTGFSLFPSSADQWRITLPPGFHPACPSPELVAATTVNDWWRQDLEGREWRRLANEVQMLWFDHPVNQKRFDQGRMPINNLWLFGGARPAQLKTVPDATLPAYHADHRLRGPMLAQDWASWLEGMGQLETEVFPSLDRTSEVTMVGRDRIVSYTTENRFWKRLHPGTKESWKKWWSPQN